MRSWRRIETVEIYHPTIGKAATGGRTITYPGSASITTKGMLVPTSTTASIGVGGRMVEADAFLYLDDDVDIRPLARSSNDEKTSDRVVVDSQQYLAIWCEKIKSRGGFIKVWLISERE
jgi:hypothetical protein